MSTSLRKASTVFLILLCTACASHHHESTGKSADWRKKLVMIPKPLSGNPMDAFTPAKGAKNDQ